VASGGDSDEKPEGEAEEKTATLTAALTGKTDTKTPSMTILMDRVRATLPLNGEDEFFLDRRRRDRLKDVCRVVRGAKKKGQILSLSVNTDFAGALKALKQHHSESWVGPSLEAIWETMRGDNTAFVFELWLQKVTEDGKSKSAPRLVAADFGHPHTNGKAYYVATRFFDREMKTLQPGFILAFAEAMCLKNAGVELWDLGGADASPMMHYKPQVAIEMDRSDFIRRLRELSQPRDAMDMISRKKPLTDPEAAPAAGGSIIPTGVIFADLQETDIWGAAALKAVEEKSKAAADAAAKAAKKAKSFEAGCKGAKPKKAPGDAPAGEAKAKKAPKPKAQSDAPTGEAAKEPSVEVANGAAATAAPDPPSVNESSDNKADMKKQFALMVQQFMAEGATQTEAAARALKAVGAA